MVDRNNDRLFPRGLATRLFETLCTPPFAYSTNDLIEIMWADGSGGPLWARECVWSAALRLRRGIERSGLLLRLQARGGYWRLVLGGRIKQGARVDILSTPP